MAVEELDFYRLSRPVQERFIAATQGLSVPRPIGLKRASKVNVTGWLLAGTLDLMMTLVLIRLGFGDLESKFAIASLPMLVAYACLLSSSVACFLCALVRRQRTASLPYSAASYLFPVGVVEALSSTLRLYPLTDLESVHAKGRILRLVFKLGKSFEFDAPNDNDASHAKDLVLEAQRNLLAADASQNPRALALLDPLRDNGFSSVFSPTTAFKRRAPTWVTLWPLIALLLGVSAGFALWRARNSLSEEHLYAAACAMNTPEAYRSYLKQGGSRNDVVETLLPRAELKSAEALGTVEALDRYVDQHPNSKIEAEVSAARRSALLSELEKAKQQGTLGALHELRSRYKNVSAIDPEIEQAERDLYQLAFEHVAAVAAGSEKSGSRAFFRRLVSYAEKHGPKATVRFRRVLYQSVHRADLRVGLSAYFMGKPSIPSQYFNEPRSRQREEVASRPLLASLGQHFPPDVLAFTLGAAFDEPDAEKNYRDTNPPFPDVDEPTVLISYGVEMNGHFTSPKPRGVYAGTGLLFHALFELPGDPERLEFKFSIWRLPDLNQAKLENLKPDAVYENMSAAAFNAFTEKYLATLFKSESRK